MSRPVKPKTRMSSLQYVGMRVPKPLLKIIDKAAAQQSRTRSNFMVLSSVKAAQALVDAQEAEA